MNRLVKSSAFGNESVEEVKSSKILQKKIACFAVHGKGYHFTLTQVVDTLLLLIFFSLLLQARQINISSLGSFYESPMFTKNRFVHDKKRKLIIQTL